MTFAIAGPAYDNFMGRYSSQLAPQFADFAGVTGDMRVLDVGAGPGALTSVLVQRVGVQRVLAIEPSPPFVEACRSRLPGVDVRQGGAETLPWKDGEMDAALSQLVLAFVRDAKQVAREMRRVVRPGGTVAACMWLAGPGLPITDLFWQAAAVAEPALRNAEGAMPFRASAEIAQLWHDTGLRNVEQTTLTVRAQYRDFDDLWSAIEHGAGPVGAYIAKADDARRQAIRAQYHTLLGQPAGAFTLDAHAGAARATT